MLLLSIASSEGGGFNPLDLSQGGGMLWTWIIFLAALPFIWKVVMGPITKALTERDEHAARAIAQAERASADAERAKAAVESALSQAQADAAKLMAEARARGEVRQHEIVEAAKLEATNLVESARKAIRTEQDKAVAAIRNEVVDLSLRAASKVLERNVTSEDDRRLVSELVSTRSMAKN